jgi:hypothetical protein
MAYNRGSSASHTSTRGDCLTTASDLDWSVCLQTLSDSQLTNSLYFDSSHISAAQIQRETWFLCWYGWCITCSIVVALSAWRWTAWQHCFPQLSYCYMTTTVEGRCAYWATALQWPLCSLNYSGFQWTCHNIFQGPNTILSVISINPKSQVCVSIMMSLLTAGN